MSGAADGPSFEVRAIGLSHRTAPVGIREALAYSEPDAVRWVELAVEEGAVDLGGARIREAALLSTCNRTEAYLVLGGNRGGPAGLDSRLARMLCNGRIDPECGAFYHYRDREAALHLARVATGLDSMIQGEAQILGQVHRAHELAREADGVGPILDRLFMTAFRGAKRARSESGIGRGAVSVASAAVELAVKVVGPLGKKTALVVGAGETGRLVAQHLSSESPHELWITNRTPERGRALAAEVGGHFLELPHLPELLQRADVVVVAASAPQPLITRASAHEAIRRRRHSTIFIDISVPRNVEPSVNELDNAFVYDVDALQEVVRENLARRAGEIPRVELILDEEIRQFSRWLGSLGAGPLIAQLREHFEQVRRDEVRRHSRGLGADQAEVLERVTRGILNKFLHGPTVHLRNGGASDPESIEAVRRIFQLERQELERQELEKTLEKDLEAQDKEERL